MMSNDFHRELIDDEYERYLATPNCESDSDESVTTRLSPTEPATSLQKPRVRAEIVQSSSTVAGARSGGHSMSRSETSMSTFLSQGARDFNHRLISEVRELVWSVNIFGGGGASHLPLVTRVYCGCIILTAIQTFGVVTFMLVDQIMTTGSSDNHVGDGSACSESGYTVSSFLNSITYAIVVFAVNVLFVVWFGLRGVKLEKGSSVFSCICVSLFHVSRVMFYVFGGSFDEYYHNGTQIATAVRWSLISTCITSVLPVLLSYHVYSNFGWLTYAKGVTQASQLEQLKRHVRFDATLKLDTFITANGLISILFLVEDTSARIAGAVVTGVTFVLLFRLKAMIRARRTWYLLLTSLVGCVSLGTFVALVVVLLTADTSSSGCLSGKLVPCLTSDVSPLSTPCSVAVADSCAWNRNVSLSVSTDTFPSDSTFFELSFGRALLLPNASSIPNVPLPGFLLNGCNIICFSLFEVSEIVPFVEKCCATYGICVLARSMQSHDQVVMIGVAIAAVLARLASFVLAYRRRREMEIPSVEDMFKRAERNLNELRRVANEMRLTRSAEGARKVAQVPMQREDIRDNEGTEMRVASV